MVKCAYYIEDGIPCERDFWDCPPCPVCGRDKRTIVRFEEPKKDVLKRAIFSHMNKSSTRDVTHFFRELQMNYSFEFNEYSLLDGKVWVIESYLIATELEVVFSKSTKLPYDCIKGLKQDILLKTRRLHIDELLRHLGEYLVSINYNTVNVTEFSTQECVWTVPDTDTVSWYYGEI